MTDYLDRSRQDSVLGDPAYAAAAGAWPACMGRSGFAYTTTEAARARSSMRRHPRLIQRRAAISSNPVSADLSGSHPATPRRHERTSSERPGTAQRHGDLCGARRGNVVPQADDR